MNWYSATFYYGDKSGATGHGTAQIDWGLSVTNTSTYANATFSTQTYSTKYVASLFNGAAGVAGGGSLIHTCNTVTKGRRPPGVQGSSGLVCTLGDSHNYNHNMVTQISWFDSTAQDYHYIYTRSVVAHTASLGASYTFNAANSIPGSANGIGDSN